MESTQSTNADNTMDPPLSWKEARARLRRFLNEYMTTAPTRVVNRIGQDTTDLNNDNNDVNNENKKRRSKLLRWWLKWDLDLHIGALGGSLSLLIIAIVSLGQQAEDIDGLFRHIAQSEVSGATLLLLGCIFNHWVVRRRRFACSQGSDGLKRREIFKYLKDLERQEEECIFDESKPISIPEDGMNLVGTSLTDIYPVYRLNQRKDDLVVGASWNRIPTLLLVRGDYIALQVGDIAPASCVALQELTTNAVISAGERITLESFGSSTNSVVGNLPRGRTTLQKDSDELLTLCNQMEVFVLLESPLELFLREPRVQLRKPKVLRQLDEIRAASSLAGFAVFFVTAVILFSRPDLPSNSWPDILPLPFLAALGVFPLTGPAFLVFVEVLGTARILLSYHPVSSRNQDAQVDDNANPEKFLLLRYILATASNRLSLQENTARACYGIANFIQRFIKGEPSFQSEVPRSELVRVPPASLNLLEKLGVATAFTLVDDELACETHAIPQQLLIPSGKGMKLLDICPTYDDESDDESGSDQMREGEDKDSDSDSDDYLQNNQHNASSGRKRLRLLRRQYSKRQNRTASSESDEGSETNEVQFEDPRWWQHLPSLKCIGLACLLVDEIDEHLDSTGCMLEQDLAHCIQDCKKALCRLICAERRGSQLRSLSQCIGFSTKKNIYGARGDVSPFDECFRLHVVSTALLRERLQIDSHERGSEESRWWGLLRPDSTSVIVQDSRSGAYQLLTVGNPQVVTRMCQEAWQGESSTILPLGATDRKTILDTSKSWKLADLDVAAFSYAPIPHTFESSFTSDGSKKARFYLLDNDSRGEALLPYPKDKTVSGEWPLVQNQIFLGILGSLVIPRQEIQGLLSTLQDAGVRFVYFSPRNMRRQKEIASQMGIDVAWNCAISLRPLDAGEEDPHRMVSAYADWDVNAKLPHGIESVKWHLKEVDNVPLLVSLFTDVTKKTTMEMIETFQEYSDTVITIGLSHLPRNGHIFSTADLAVGVDILTECIPSPLPAQLNCNNLLPSEITFVSAISAHSCAFRLRGVTSIAYMPTLIAQGRASLEAATSAMLFVISGCLSFSLFVLFSTCAILRSPPDIPILGSVLYLQIVLPLVGLAMTMSDPDDDSMKRVPPKNDQSVTFGRKEGKVLYYVLLLKALLPAVLPQILYLIAFGEFMITFEPDLVASKCQAHLESGDWMSTVRCRGLDQYGGVARTSSGAIVVAELILCTVVASASFVPGTKPLVQEPPWRRNHAWAYSVVACMIIITVYLSAILEKGSLAILPWYFFFIASVIPFLCLAWNEFFKRSERSYYHRAEKLRRLQFETRLGMWSPK